jgi:hypothetical protein
MITYVEQSQLEQLVVAQLAKTVHDFCEAGRIIVVYTRAQE